MDFLIDYKILEILSLITTIIGLYLLGEKKRSGFLIFDFSLLCQMIIFICNKNYFLIFQMIVLISFNSYNYVKWGKTK